MTLTTERTPIVIPTLLEYPEGITPFGELRVQHISHTVGNKTPVSRHIDTILEVMGPRVVYRAMVEADWAQPPEGVETPTENKPESYQGQRDVDLHLDIMRAAYTHNRQSVWFAIKPVAHTENGKPIYSDEGYISGGQVVGIGYGRIYETGNLFTRTFSRVLHPNAAEAQLMDFAVLPDAQRNNIGAALLFANLRLFKPEQKPTAEVAKKNDGLIRKLAELSFEPVGIGVNAELVPGQQTETVKLQGENVERVTDLLVEKYAWLEGFKKY